MKKIWTASAIGAALGLLGMGAIVAQTISVPQVQSIGSGDLFQDVVNGAPQAGNVYAPATLLGNYAATLPGNNPENALIGGDATTNLWQRATTGSSVTTTVTYGGPDRWAYWSGTGTAMTVSRDSTAADLPTAGYQFAFKMARTSGQTGVVPVCMIQEVESVNSFAFAGNTAEVDFHAATGSNFSGASGNMFVSILFGTGTDEGISKAAFSLNSGGGGASAWTGAGGSTVTVNLNGASTNGRYTVVAPIPATATELAVALCYTPTGTAGTNDYIAFSGIQLTRNNALTTVAGTNGAQLLVNDTRAKAFARRSQAAETVLQQRYFQLITEPGNNVPVAASGQQSTTTQCNLTLPLAVQMRVAPAITFTGTALATTTWQIQSGGTTSTLASSTFLASLATGSQTVNVANLKAQTTSNILAGNACVLAGQAGGSVINISAEL